MKPEEFWNSGYLEINIYCQAHLIKTMDDLKREINLQEAVTNKLIRADSMSKRPKIIPNEIEQVQSPDEIAKRMREVMNVKKK